MSTLTPSGRPYRRTQAQVFAEETHCWLCGEWVDQRLPHNNPKARSLDHVTPLARGGHPTNRANARLAHRDCNSERGDATAMPTNPRTVEW